MSDVATCKGCGAEIIWKETPKGKRIPLDHQPSGYAPGAYLVAGKLAVAGEPLLDPPGTEYHLNHWVTCTTPDRFRTEKGSTT